MPTSRTGGTSPSPFQALLKRLHARFAALDDGQVATYNPELAKADPAAFGIAIATVDGQVYEVGDTRQPFTLQSIPTPLVYGLALQDQGREGVERIVGVEPSGEAFNAISLEPGTGRPRKPMINAGAIAVASLVQGSTDAERLGRHGLGLRRPAAGHRRGGLRVGARHRPPQSRHRPPAAQSRHPGR